jgi:hypothetical protein
VSYVIAPIVEGYGDVDAVPVLLRRMAPELHIARPVRQGRGKLISKDGLRHAAAIAASNIREAGAILVLFDADRDCAAELAAQASGWLAEDFGHLMSRIALAVRGFEAWIVGGDVFYGEDDPDNAGDVKGRIEARYGTYKKTVDQPRYIAAANFDRLQNHSRSFRHLRKVVEEFSANAAAHG